MEKEMKEDKDKRMRGGRIEERGKRMKEGGESEEENEDQEEDDDGNDKLIYFPKEGTLNSTSAPDVGHC